MAETDPLPFTNSPEIEYCSNSGCHIGTARYFIECKNNYTGSIYIGQCCDNCLSKATENDYKITGYIIYPAAIEKELPERKSNADFGYPSGIWDMKSLVEAES